MLFVKTHLAR